MDIKKPNVLIVDDEPVLCKILSRELSKRGYLCSTALNGHSALTELGAQEFDVILLDIKLPDLSGMEVLSNIRSTHSNTVAIMMTAVSSADTVVEAMKLGAADYIVKPFSLDRVCTSIRRILVAEKQSKGKSDCQTTPHPGSETEDRSVAMGEFYRQMDAIARGVEARQDLIFSHSKIVVEETIDIARKLGIPDKVIKSWTKVRLRLNSERERAVKNALDKLELNALAQQTLGLLRPYLCAPNIAKS